MRVRLQGNFPPSPMLRGITHREEARPAQRINGRVKMSESLVAKLTEVIPKNLIKQREHKDNKSGRVTTTDHIEWSTVVVRGP